MALTHETIEQYKRDFGLFRWGPETGNPLPAEPAEGLTIQDACAALESALGEVRRLRRALETVHMHLQTGRQEDVECAAEFIEDTLDAIAMPR